MSAQSSSKPQPATQAQHLQASLLTVEGGVPHYPTADGTVAPLSLFVRATIKEIKEYDSVSGKFVHFNSARVQKLGAFTYGKPIVRMEVHPGDEAAVWAVQQAIEASVGVVKREPMSEWGLDATVRINVIGETPDGQTMRAASPANAASLRNLRWKMACAFTNEEGEDVKDPFDFVASAVGGAEGTFVVEFSTGKAKTGETNIIASLRHAACQQLQYLPVVPEPVYLVEPAPSKKALSE